jgi:hypothetical protein
MANLPGKTKDRVVLRAAIQRSESAASPPPGHRIGSITLPDCHDKQFLQP